MTSRHYDVVVLGRSLGALVAAALLARRDFRVLLLGQGQKPPSYRFERHVLKRRALTLLVATSPAWRRVLQELAQTPRFRRRTQALDPMFVVLCPGRRMEVPPDMELFGREVDREFPEVRQLVDELYAAFASVNAAVDAAFERDVVWPPGTLWERWETGRAVGALPLVGRNSQHDLLGKFPPGHGYRDLVNVPAQFATDLAIPGHQLPPLALARLHGSWTRGVFALADGEDELAAFLIERIEAHGGVVRLDRRATQLVVRRGVAAGIVADDDEEPIGAGAVVTDQPGELVADLSGGQGITKLARHEWPRVAAAAGRFVVGLVVRTAGLPDALGREAFLFSSSVSRYDPRRAIVHLQRVSSSEEEGAPHETVLVAESILPTRGPVTLLDARDIVLGTLCESLPFLQEHLVVVDSVYDGLPLHQYDRGQRREVDRIHVREDAARAEPMQWQWTVEPPGFLALSGEPIRGPIPGVYLAGKTVLPALGQEGELLAAWGAVRIITRKDGARQRVRQQMWSKIETG
ncbi:NAD(P)-binding protein [Myxococcota bacterium]